VTFKGQAFWTKNIFSNLVIPVGQELAELSSAHRAFHLITPVKKSRKLHKNHADPYQPRPGYQIYEKRNYFSHMQKGQPNVRIFIAIFVPEKIISP
jgi:hypothetical protein